MTGELVRVASVSIDPPAAKQRGKTRYRVTLSCGCSWWEERDEGSPPPTTGTYLRVSATTRTTRPRRGRHDDCRTRRRTHVSHAARVGLLADREARRRARPALVRRRWGPIVKPLQARRHRNGRTGEVKLQRDGQFYAYAGAGDVRVRRRVWPRGALTVSRAPARRLPRASRLRRSRVR